MRRLERMLGALVVGCLVNGVAAMTLYGTTAVTKTAKDQPPVVAAQANSGTSAILSEKPPLPAPEGVEARSGGDRVLIAWHPNPPVANIKPTYQLFRSPTPLSGSWTAGDWPKPINQQPITEEYFLDMAGFSASPPEYGQVYFYTLIAVDYRGNSSTSSQPLRVLNIPILCAPGDIQALPGNQSIELKWLPAFSGGEAGLCGYMIYRSGNKNELGQPLFAEPLKAESFIDQGLVNGQTYYYTFFAEDNEGQRSQAVSQVSSTPFAPPSAPRNLQAIPKSDDMITLTWQVSQPGDYGFKGYRIYRKSEQEESYGKPINKNVVRTSSFIDSETNSTSKPTLGRDYTYMVKAVDEKDNESSPSNEVKAAPLKPIAIPRQGILSTSIPGLPPNSSLSISGRKKIDIGYTEVIPLNTSPGGSDTRSPSITSGLTKGFNLEQELQVRLEGKVGDKITVDVDYDDTQEEQRKISIKYAGDPDDVVQEAAFGDINLDLEKTEFAGYNKNLFGARFKVAYRGFEFTAIGAQTKGITVTENFTGNTSPKKSEIQDTSFLAYKYYYLTKDWPNQVNHYDLPIYETEQAFYADSNPNKTIHGIIRNSEQIWVRDGINIADSKEVTDSGNTTNVYYNQLSPGIDYTVNYQTGEISFARTMSRLWSIAVAYQYVDASGNTVSVGYDGDEIDLEKSTLTVPVDGKTNDNAHLIQEFDSNDPEKSKNYIMMNMNRYALGYQNIIDPQSDPDFNFQIFKSSGAEYPIPQPNEGLNAEKIYKIDPNFGTIEFRNLYPFQGSTLDNPDQRYLSDNYDNDERDAYSSTYNTVLGGTNNSTANNVAIHVAFKNKIPTFNLSHGNIISNSEVIRKDGLKLQRNTDYFIDYDTGFITFLNPDSIASTSDISITYEYLPFGGQFQTNLFGARAEYDILGKERLTIGSTFLYNASQPPLDIPDVNSTPTSLAILDGDIQLQLNPKDFSELIRPIFGETKLPLTLDVSAEAAYSQFEENTFRKSGENGVAMIDSMDGSDNILSIPVGNNSNNIWFPSSEPTTGSFSPTDRQFITRSVVYEYGRAPVDSNDKKHQLKLTYNQLDQSKWDGFVYSIDASGRNLHEYSFLEVVAYSSVTTTGRVNLNIDLGLVNEDSNGNGVLNFEIAPDDDTGITQKITGYDVNRQPVFGDDPTAGARGEGSYPNTAHPEYWGEGLNNNIIQSEDLDNDFEYDTVDSHYEYTIDLKPGWQVYKIPLANTSTAVGTVITDPQDPGFFSFIKHARIWLTGASASAESGFIRFESIQITGNKWQPKVAPNYPDSVTPITEVPADKLNATAISQETSDVYVPNTFFNVIDTLENETKQILNEKSLKLEYKLDNSDSIGGTLPAYYFTRTLTTASQGYDYSRYRHLRLDIYKYRQTAANSKLIIRLGIDENNFFQYTVNLDELQPAGAWHTVQLELDNRDGKREEVFSSEILSGLNNIKMVSIGIISPNTFAPIEPDIIWINNLRVTGAKSKEGLAYRISSNTKYGDVFTVSTDHRDVEGDFFTIDESPRGKQRKINSSVNGSITKFNFLPINANWTRTESFTEKEHLDDLAYSNNLATPDVVTETISGSVGYTQIQGLDINISGKRTRNVREYLEQRTQPNNKETVATATSSLSYSLPQRVFNVPIGRTTLTGKLIYTDAYTNYNQEDIDSLTNSVSASNTFYTRVEHSYEESYEYTGDYSPIKFIKLSPQFTYRQKRHRGDLSLYRKYYREPGSQPDDNRFREDDYIDSKQERVARLNASFPSLPVIAPSMNYTMSNNQDFIQDALANSGSLTLRSDVSLGDMIGWKKFPKFNVSQTYTKSATYKYQSDNDTIETLTMEDLWLIDPLGFKENDDKFDRAFINSRKVTTSINSSFALLTNVTLAPQFSDSWTKNMNTTDNYITTETQSIGGTLNWQRIPTLNWITFQTLNLDYRYAANKQLNTKGEVASENLTHSGSLTLPFVLSRSLNGNFTSRVETGTKQTGIATNSLLYENEYSAGLSFTYNLNMTEPVRLPNFWPFNGALLKLEQTLRLSNAFNVKFVDDIEKNGDVPIKTSANNQKNQEYTNETSVKYSLWKNVEGDVRITNQWFFDNTVINENDDTRQDKDYWAISLKAGLTAVF